MSTAEAAAAPARWRAAALAGAGTLAVAATLLGGALRLFRLGDRGFWYDEIVTADYARLGTPGDVIDLVRYWGDHAPLAYLITWALRGLGGSEWAVRLHYALAGTLAVFAMYLLGRALLGKSGGLIAALLMAISPFAVYYGQEARPYTYVLLFSCLQALAAYRAAERSRPADWLLLALWTVLNLYTHYVALAVTAVCLAYIVVSLAADAWRAVRAAAPERKRAWRRFGGVMMGAGASAGLAALGYLPWLDAVQAFFERRDVGFGRYPPAPVTLDDLGRMLDSFGLTGLVLAVVVLGLASAVAVVWHGPRRAGAFLLLWAALPFAYMWWQMGPTIVLLPPRYVMFWFPLGVLLAALGVRVAAGVMRRLVGRIRPRAAYTLSAVAVAIWMLPGLVGSYAVEKDQFREGAAYVLGEQSGRGPATVLVVGEIGTKLLPPFVVEAVEYYFWLHQAPVEVMDGTRLGRGTVERMERERRTPWLAFYTDVAEDKRAEARAAGFDVAPFRGVTLVRAVGGDTLPGAQLGRLLDLATAWYPQLVATRSALDEAFRDEHTGDNLLPPVRAVSDVTEESWRVGPGASVDEGSGVFTVDLAGWQTDVSLMTRRLEPGRSYVLLFRADNEALTGKQMVYIKTQAADGRALEDVPDWRGYRVRPDNGRERQGVAFTVPDETAAVTVRFAADGRGSARVWDVELRPVR